MGRRKRDHPRDGRAISHPSDLPADERIARHVERLDGIISRTELHRLGISDGAISHRLRCGRLRRLHPGVYAVGHEALTPRARWRAAVLYAAPSAALSHRSSAALAGFIDFSLLVVDVTAQLERAPQPGLVIHRGRLPGDEITTIDGIVATTPARTILDLASVLGPRPLENAVNEAVFMRLVDHSSLASILMRYPRRRGRAKLRRILERWASGLEVTRSELEDRFLAFVARYGLPRPALNARVSVGGQRFEVDCVWREQRLIVELDGRAAHATPAAFERDRERDRALTAAGWRVIRVTWRQLHDAADDLAADLRAALAAHRR